MAQRLGQPGRDGAPGSAVCGRHCIKLPQTGMGHEPNAARSSQAPPNQTAVIAVRATWIFNQMVDKTLRPGLALYSTRWLSLRRKAVAADPLSRVFAALADPTRRDMVARLATGDATVNELARPYDVTVQAGSKHLKVLADAGLVSRPSERQRRPVHLVAEVFVFMSM